jgi:hypothetical protein
MHSCHPLYCIHRSQARLSSPVRLANCVQPDIKSTKVKCSYVIHFIVPFYNIELFNMHHLLRVSQCRHRKHESQLLWINLTLVRT